MHTALSIGGIDQ